MTIGSKKAPLAAAVAAVALIAASSSASAAGELRCEHHEDVTSVSQAASPSILAQIRSTCPVLADIVEEFALRDLGEAFPPEGAKPRVRDIVAMAALAASGDLEAMKRRAADALDAGATVSEFQKALYLTAVNAGAAKAIEATRALTELLAEQPGRWPGVHLLPES